jgi:outer membrane protein insertion porin family
MRVQGGGRRAASGLGACLLGLIALAAPARAAQGDAGTPPAAQEAPAAQEPQEAPAEQQEPAEQRREPPIVDRVEVRGNRRYSREQVLLALGQREGRPLDGPAISAGVKQLWGSFRVRAETALLRAEGAPADGREHVILVLTLVEMPSDLEPRFIGNDSIKLERLREWALIEDRTELFLHQAPRVRQRILEGYQREGFYWAEVNIVARGEDETSAALSDVIFEIREGPRVRVRGVEIHGNDSMPDERSWIFFKDGLSHLAKRELAGKRLTNWFGSKFVAETLEADVLAMRQVYRDRGWLDAVVEVERLQFNAERNRVTIHIAVDEGPRYTVSRLRIEGVRHGEGDDDFEPVPLEVPEEELLAKCLMIPGAVIERVTVDKDREALRGAFSELGRIYHDSLPRSVSWDFLEPVYVFDVENKTAEVIYRVVQGRRLTIREVKFAGTSHTRDRVLRREVSIFPGDQADLKEINRSLTRIHGTGYFNDEYNKLDHRLPFYRFEPVDGDPAAVDLVFEVQEGRVIDFQISGGVDSDDGLFGVVNLGMRNFDVADTPRSLGSTFRETYDKEAFHGAGQRVDIELAPGTELSRYRFHFLEPDLFRLHLNPISLDLDLSKRVRRYDTHDEDRFISKIALGRKFTQDLSMSVGYVWSDVEVDDLDDPAVPQTLADQEPLGEQVVTGPSFDLLYRKLDNYISPRDGFSVRWNNRFNLGSLGSDIEYIDSQVHLDGYKPVGTKEDGTKILVHLGLDLGVSPPVGDTDVLPYSERSFLGGSQTMRGFGFRGVGPMDELSGYALGGETYANASLEWIYPLHSTTQPGTYQRQEMLRGILFCDTGVLDEDPFQLDPSEVRMSVGFGIGLAYPLPLSLNFGFPVLYKDEDVRQVFSFTLALF